MFLRIQRKSTGQFMVNESGAVLTIERHTTLFNNQDELLGSFTYPGSGPIEGNELFIENAHYISTNSNKRTFDAVLWLGNLPYKQVKFIFTVENGTINYTLFIDMSILASQLKTLKMYQVEKAEDQFHIAFDNGAALQAFMTASAEAAPGDFPCVFFPFINDAAYKVVDPDDYGNYPDLDFPIERIFNRWEMDAMGNGSFKVDDSLTNQQSQTPFWLLTYVIKRLISFFGCKPVGNWLNEETSNRIVIYTNQTINVNILADYHTYMPDMTVSDFIKACRTEFGLLLDFDLNLNICLVESVFNLSNTPDTFDLRDKQLNNNIRETSNTTTRYLVSQTPDDKDAAYSDTDKTQLPQLLVGDPSASASQTDLTLTSACTKMTIEPAPSKAGLPDMQANWKVPYLKQAVYGAFPGIGLLEPEDAYAFKLRFLYYHGMRPNDSGFLYPYGSVDNINVLGDPISTHTLSLSNSSTAILALKEYYTFIVNSKPFELGVTLSRDEFFNIQAKKRFLVRDFNQATISCLLDQVAADLGEKETIFTKITLYPVIRVANPQQVFPAIPIDPGTPTEPPFDNGTVYARLRIANINNHNVTLPPPAYTYTDCDLFVDFFSDAAATIAKSVTDLGIRIRVKQATTGLPDHNVFDDYSCNSNVQLLQTGAVLSSTAGAGTSYTYTLLSSPYYFII